MRIDRLLWLIAIALVLVTGGPVSAADPLAGIPMPFLFKANVTVNGSLLSGVDPTYSLKVKSTGGQEYLPVDTGGDTFGETVPDRFQYKIPKYDALTQPNGAQTNAKACVEIYRYGGKLTITSPAQGQCLAGSAEITVGGDGETIGFGGIAANYEFAQPITVTRQTGKLNLNPLSLPFGELKFGARSDLPLTVRNDGTGPLHINSLTFSGNPDFSLVSPPALPFTIAVGESLVLTARYYPKRGGAASATLTINSDDAETGPIAVQMTGSTVTSLLLKNNWNLIGLPVPPMNQAVSAILAPVIADVAIVWGYDGSAWTFYDPLDTAGSTLKDMALGNGYWIKMKAQRTLVFE